MSKIPLVILTGFLGSGKTTLATRFLRSRAGKGTGIIVNEFGKAGVDQALLVHAAKDVELISGGRADLEDIISAIHEIVRKSKAQRAQIERILFETSGLGDPTPIICALGEDAWLRQYVELTKVITVVDAVSGIDNIDVYPEARLQIGVCDAVVITKSDLRVAAPRDSIINAIMSVAPDAGILDSQDPDFDVTSVFCAREPAKAIKSLTPFGSRSSDITSFICEFDDVLDWPLFTIWLSALLHRHGDKILRVKGVIKTTASTGSLAVHGVQKTMHPPVHLPPGQSVRGSYLVFIARSIDLASVMKSYECFANAAASALSKSLRRRYEANETH